jgi:hypothetical protein
MASNVYPFIDPMTQPAPVYMHLIDINSIGSFFVFMDAAIRCYPFVLLTSFALSLLFIYIIVNSRKIYQRIIYSYSNYLYNKYLHNKGGE